MASRAEVIVARRRVAQLAPSTLTAIIETAPLQI
jgi:hypothetical protein